MSAHRGIALVVLLVVAIGIPVAVAGCSASDGDAPIATTSTTTSTTPEMALVGSWRRSGGDYSVLQGMVVEVGPDGTEGTITAVDRNPYGFAVGDVKWRTISAVRKVYRFQDMSRQSGSGAVSYLDGYMTLSDDGLVLELTFPSTRTSQTWTRED